MKVLHIIPDSAKNSNLKYLGSTKDILARTQYFKKRQIEFDEFVVIKRSDNFLLQYLKNTDLSIYKVILIENLIYIKCFKYIKKKYPKIILIARSINAEFLHKLHYMLGSIKIKKKILYIKSAFFRLYQDYICSKYADHVLTITEWEKENYWKFITKKSKLIYCPYFLPEIYKTEIDFKIEKKDYIVCMMGLGMENLILLMDSFKRLDYLVSNLKEKYKNWKFFITGVFKKEVISEKSNINYLGVIDSPFKILSETKALSILSDLGLGFKTKILDAICAKNYILLNFNLYKNLPEEIKKYCIIVNPNSIDSFYNGLDLCSKPFPKEDVNELLKNKAFMALDKIIN